MISSVLNSEPVCYVDQTKATFLNDLINHLLFYVCVKVSGVYFITFGTAGCIQETNKISIRIVFLSVDIY